MAAELYELSNGTITVKMTNFGATITSLLVPDANGDEFLTLFPSRSSSLPHKGNLADVVLGFDTVEPYQIGSRIHELQVGYDHNYVLDCGEERSGLKHAAKVKDPSSSRVLDLWTDAPGMQFYTGNYVDGIVGKGSAVYGKHAALCLETQGFPNAINQPNFPSVVVQPGEKHKHTMLFEFSTD
ncbi:hypothetical protein BHE74_00010971 [Ensete ventricosum]|nr:hypothetical protein GW17_00020558 [Ensete ventricosum]RWW80676.1 hypothetical protein BHE74_00010971 [Ensete ventricosum]